MEQLKLLTSDEVFAYILQGAFFLLWAIAFANDAWRHFRGGIDVGVKRGADCMKRLHGAYVALAFIVLLLTLNVEIYEGRRAFFAALNLGLLATLVFFSVWFRGHVFKLIQLSSTVERARDQE